MKRKQNLNHARSPEQLFKNVLNMNAECHYQPIASTYIKSPFIVAFVFFEGR